MYVVETGLTVIVFPLADDEIDEPEVLYNLYAVKLRAAEPVAFALNLSETRVPLDVIAFEPLNVNLIVLLP